MVEAKRNIMHIQKITLPKPNFVVNSGPLHHLAVLQVQSSSSFCSKLKQEFGKMEGGLK